ncbi:MAG TPA: iron-containing redox enzyme family protein [Acidimicrobiales bacterium]|nr:iron-containing redox enzyme family protein [Acidimicrobiales bacterium]
MSNQDGQVGHGPGPAVLPCPRGPLTDYLLDHLVRPPHPMSGAPAAEDDALDGDDSQLALYCCYELHYRSMAGVAEAWEWEPSLLAFRHGLEDAFERRLREVAGVSGPFGDVQAGLRRAIADHRGPSLSSYVEVRAGIDQLRELAVHRSAYQLKEADPHSWGIPRLSGRAKAAIVEIQFDEYGGGVDGASHAELWADTMDALGLDSTYGSYLDLLPGITLATTNVISLFGLHRRLRGALVGHLAAFEMTSVVPMGRYAAALARLGVSPRGRRFYDVHVAADAVHEVVACERLAGGLADAEPALAADIVLGARALIAVEERFARHVLECWESDTTSLLAPVPEVARPTA